jgi:hypothetical protein
MKTNLQLPITVELLTALGFKKATQIAGDSRLWVKEGYPTFCQKNIDEKGHIVLITMDSDMDSDFELTKIGFVEWS